MSKLQKYEFRINQLQKAATENKNHDIRCKEMFNMQQRAITKSLYKRMHMEAQEAEMEKNITMAKEEQSRQIALLEQEQKLAQTLAELKRKELAEKKKEQLVYENCHELQQLEKQIRTAYARKELLAQIREKEANKLEAKVQDYYDDLKMIEINENEKRFEDEFRTKQLEKELNYRNRLRKQLADAENKKKTRRAVQMCYPLTLGNSETNSNDDKLLKMKNLKKELDECVRLKNERKENENKQTETTEKHIQDFLNYKKRIYDAWTNEKKTKQEQIHKVKEHVADNFLSLVSNKSDNINMKVMLHDEEQKIEDWMKQKAERDHKTHRRNELIKQNNAQLINKKEVELDQKRQDKIFAENLIKLNEEKNKQEEIKNNTKQKENIQYRKELKELIDKKHCDNKELWIKKQSEYKEAIKLEQQRLKEIEDKRRNIIKHHEAALLGFLPPTLLTKNSID